MISSGIHLSLAGFLFLGRCWFWARKISKITGQQFFIFVQPPHIILNGNITGFLTQKPGTYLVLPHALY